MVPLSSSIVSPFLIAGLVVGAVPYTVARSVTADEDAHRPVAMVAPSSEDLAAEHRYLELAEASAVEPPAEATVEEAAIALAASLAAIPVGNLEGAASCPTEKLTVSWEEPSAEHSHGAFVTPLGPAPGPDTDEVNGVVLCDGYPYAFMGFEAARDGSTWDVVAVPFLGADEDEHGHEPANDDADDHDHDDDEPAEPTQPAPPAPRIDIPVADLGPIEGYAAYEPQRICHPTAKPGTDALRRLLTGHYTSTRNLGIARGCTVGGRSEHKEGRAFDWGAYAHREMERRSVEDLIGRLLATDEAGNRHALARRMGVMYIIWNERIWSAYRSDAGWRPYGGRSPHTDHAHISLSWDGAMGRTSFWNANGVEALFGTPAGTTVAAVKPVQAAPAAPEGHAERDDHDEEHEATDEARADRDEAREKYERRIREWREARERRQREREERRAAGLPIDEQSEAELAVRDAEEATAEAKEALEEAEDDAEKAERRAQREADRANRRAEWREERERRQQEREERQAERAAERDQRQTQKDAERAERQAQKDAERAERQAQKDAERAERQAQKDAERAERQAQKDAERAERQAQKEREREERRAEKEREREERRAEKERERAERRAEKERERAERRAEKERERAERRAEKEAARAEREREREEREREDSEEEPEEEDGD